MSKILNRGVVRLFEVGSARLAWVGHLNAKSNWAMTLHTHPYWEFIYFVRGCGHVDVPSARLSPYPYHLIIYPPGLPHAEWADPSDPVETLYIGIDVPGDPPAGTHLLLSDHDGELGWLCSRIHAEHEMFGVTPLAGAYVATFLHLVERLWSRGVSVPHDSIDTVIQHIHTNYASEITLDALASIACVSKTHLTNLFKTRLGTSPYQYLQHVRVEAAKRLLGTSSLLIYEIASQVGFSDPLYFSRAFRAATGLSPKAYRQRANCSV